MRHRFILAALALTFALLGLSTPHAHASGASYVQGNTVVTNASSFSVSYPNNVTSGDLLVVFYRNYDDTGGYVTDTLDGTTHWNVAVDDCTGWDVIAYIVAPSSGADTVTIYSRQTGYARASIMEYSGLTNTLKYTGSAQGKTECATTSKTAFVQATTNGTPNYLVVSGFTTTDNTTATASTCGGSTATLRQNGNTVNGSIDVEDVLASSDATAQVCYLTWGDTPKWFADIAVFS